MLLMLFMSTFILSLITLSKLSDITLQAYQVLSTLLWKTFRNILSFHFPALHQNKFAQCKTEENICPEEISTKKTQFSLKPACWSNVTPTRNILYFSTKKKRQLVYTSEIL